jgi:hypothetical protein
LNQRNSIKKDGSNFIKEVPVESDLKACPGANQIRPSLSAGEVSVESTSDRLPGWRRFKRNGAKVIRASVSRRRRSQRWIELRQVPWLEALQVKRRKSDSSFGEQAHLEPTTSNQERSPLF